MMPFSLLNWIWDFFRKPVPVPIPTPQTLSGVELGQILKPYCSNLWLSDEKYSTIDKKALEEFIAVNPVSERKYYGESHDCDNFSLELSGDVSFWSNGGAFGIVWGNRKGDGAPHAWNFFVGNDKKVYFVEPQTDQIFEPGLPGLQNLWIMIV